MTQDEWRELWEICRNAQRLPPAQRESFIRSMVSDPAISGKILDLMSATGDGPVPAQTTPLLPQGGRVGRYTLTGVLGRGGMGEAFSAHDSELGRQVALKILRPIAIDDTAGTERFIREAQAASALNHPNIVTVYEVIRWERSIAIVMELVQGETLRSLCGTPQPVKRVAEIGKQIAAALAAAHDARIVHRDVKPENIIIRADGYVKILDFGLARRLDAESLSHSGLPAGTFRYMSPEQTHGQKITPASDIFSMGIVLFELAAGSHPFPAETALQAMMAIASREPRSLLHVRPEARELGSLVDRILARNPQSRPTARETWIELQRIGSGVGELPPSRRRAIRWGAVAAPAAAALGWFGWTRTRGLGTHRDEAVPIAGAGSQVVEPALSPDGQTVLYGIKYTGEDSDIYSTTISGATTKLTSGPHQKGSPAWSPDGRTIAFVQMTGTQMGEIRVMRATGGPSRKVAAILTPQLGQQWFPGPSMRWSPDPAWLVVSARPSPQESFSLFLVHIETGEMRQLTDSNRAEAGDKGPAFSPDGRTLAFHRLGADGAHLFVMPLNPDLTPGGPARRIEASKGWNVSPAWTADGRELVFLRGMSPAPGWPEFRPGKRAPGCRPCQWASKGRFLKSAAAAGAGSSTCGISLHQASGGWI